jgi:hypothetical protein
VSRGIQPDDVGVTELFEDVRFPLEAGHRPLVTQQPQGHHLEGDRGDLVVFVEPGPVDRSHCSTTEFRLDLEAIRARADGLTDQHDLPPTGKPDIPAAKCSVFSVQCSVFSVQCSVFSVQLTARSLKTGS